jgi:hypothetical protein
MAPDPSLNGYLTPEAILAAADVQEVDVTVPEWGGRVRVRGLTMNELLDVRKSSRNGEDDRGALLATLSTAMVEPRLTTDQAAALMTKSGAAFTRVLAAINVLNGMDLAGLGNTLAGLQPDATFPGGPAADEAPGAGPGESVGTDPGPGTADDQGANAAPGVGS